MRKEEVEIWERQPGESAQAYEAFTYYRDAERHGIKRSIRSVVQKLNKSHALIGRWSSQWNWVSRTEAYDKYIEQEAIKEAIKDSKEMIKRHINIAKNLQGKAAEAFNKLVPEEMTAREILDFFKLGMEFERLTRIDSMKGFETERESEPINIIIKKADKPESTEDEIHDN